MVLLHIFFLFCIFLPSKLGSVRSVVDIVIVVVDVIEEIKKVFLFNYIYPIFAPRFEGYFNSMFTMFMCCQTHECC